MGRIRVVGLGRASCNRPELGACARITERPNKELKLLAQAVGYKSYSGANLHYGRLAALLASALEQGTGDFIGLKLMVKFVMPGEQGNAEILWIMRPELAGALEDLGWVSRSDKGA